MLQFARGRDWQIGLTSVQAFRNTGTRCFHGSVICILQPRHKHCEINMDDTLFGRMSVGSCAMCNSLLLYRLDAQSLPSHCFKACIMNKEKAPEVVPSQHPEAVFRHDAPEVGYPPVPHQPPGWHPTQFQDRVFLVLLPAPRAREQRW